jgi:hypothetical protein
MVEIPVTRAEYQYTEPKNNNNRKNTIFCLVPCPLLTCIPDRLTIFP